MRIKLTLLYLLTHSILFGQINRGVYTDCQLETARNSTNPNIVAAKQEIIDLADLKLNHIAQTSDAENGVFYILHSYGPDPQAAEIHNNMVWASLEDNEFALQLALAYQMTYNSIYAEKAIYLLNSWASANIKLYGQEYVDSLGGEAALIVPDLVSNHNTPGYYDQSGADYVMNQVMHGFIQTALLLKDYPGWNNNDQDIFTNWVNESRKYYKRFFLPGYHLNTTNQTWEWINPKWPIGTNVTNYALIHLLLTDIWTGNIDSFAANGEGKAYMDLSIEEIVRPLLLGGFNIPNMLPSEVLRGNNGMWYTSWSLEAITQDAIIFENTTGEDYFNYVNSYGSTIIDGLDQLFYYSENVSSWPWLHGREFSPDQIETGGTISPNRAPLPGSWGGTMFEALSSKLNRPAWKTWASSSIPTTYFGTGRPSYCSPTLLPASIGFGITCETNHSPTAANVTIVGMPEVGQTLTLNYDFNDEDGDTENGSIIAWSTPTIELQRGTSNTFVVPENDPNGNSLIGETICAWVHPIDIHDLEGESAQAENCWLTITQDCSGASISNLEISTNVVSNNIHSATITWEGNPNATTWLYVHELESTGPQHPATGNTYTYSTLGANYTFTVFVQGENNCEDPLTAEFSTSSALQVNSNTMSKVQIYPNPATNFLTIKNQHDFKNYSILNMVGQKIASGVLNEEVINIKALKKGIYFIELSNDTKSIINKFIKN